MKRKLGFVFFVLGLFVTGTVMAATAPKCRLVSITITYHQSTGKTTTTYHYECDGPL